MTRRRSCGFIDEFGVAGTRRFWGLAELDRQPLLPVICSQHPTERWIASQPSRTPSVIRGTIDGFEYSQAPQVKVPPK